MANDVWSDPIRCVEQRAVVFHKAYNSWWMTILWLIVESEAKEQHVEISATFQCYLCPHPHPDLCITDQIIRSSVDPIEKAIVWWRIWRVWRSWWLWSSRLRWWIQQWIRIWCETRSPGSELWKLPGLLWNRSIQWWIQSIELLNQVPAAGKDQL